MVHMERRTFKNDFISSVLFRVDFPIPIPSLMQGERPRDFQRAVLRRFPLLEEENIVGQEFKLTPSGAEPRTVDKWISYHHFDSERTARITLSPSFMFVEQTKYKGSQQFDELVKFAVDELFTAWPETTVNRAGLRYVNNIKAPNTAELLNWSDYIEPQIVAPLAIFGEPDRLSRYTQTAEFRGDGYRARVRTGIPNPDFPGLISQKIFLIDIDVFTHEALEQQDILEKYTVFQSTVWTEFTRLITQSLVDYLDS